MNDLTQRLIDVWAGVEQSVIDDASDQQRRRLCLPSSHRRTFWMLTVTQNSQNILNKFKFVKQDVSSEIIASFLTFMFHKVV